MTCPNAKYCYLCFFDSFFLAFLLFFDSFLIFLLRLASVFSNATTNDEGFWCTTRGGGDGCARLAVTA